jgi:hypothetical protein
MIMDLEELAEIRNTTQRTRRAPGEPGEVFVPFDGDGKIREDVVLGPVELTIEATDSDLDPPSWLNDDWWTDVIRRWAGCLVTVHIAPTPGALLHPVVLHQLMMLRRVTPHWRLVGHAYAHDISTDNAISEIAESPYHEIRFAVESGPRHVRADGDVMDLSTDELFSRVHQEQSRLGTKAPVLLRMPSNATRESVASAAATRSVADLPVSTARIVHAR